jgi:hypothetical protein
LSILFRGCRACSGGRAILREIFLQRDHSVGDSDGFEY